MNTHIGQPVLAEGVPLERAKGAVIMVHGRGAGPRNILELAPLLRRHDVAYLAPAAANGTWYPFSFMSETVRNEPHLTSALQRLRDLVGDVEDAGIDPAKIVLMGFSQGACLASEFAVRHAHRYGGLVAFSGGLIGPPGTTWTYPGWFDGTPVFLGCSDIDPHIPKARVEESAAVFTRMGADVTTRIYPGMGHEINEDELERARDVLDRAIGSAR
jgi:phospholipase/carboxylesterase